MTDIKHNKTPWSYTKRKGYIHTAIDANGVDIFSAKNNRRNSQEYIEFAVRASNSFDDMLEALEKALYILNTEKGYSHRDTIKNIEDVLKKARGES